MLPKISQVPVTTAHSAASSPPVVSRGSGSRPKPTKAAPGSDEAGRDVPDAPHTAYINDLVASAPVLSDDQRARLAILLTRTTA